MIKLLLIIFLSIIFIFNVNMKHFIKRENKTPKIIWAYWDSDKKPEFIEICERNWRKYAKNYKIIIVNKKTAKKYVKLPDNFDKLEPYRQSDIIRLKLIEKYGGVWLDASTILLTNPDNFISDDNLTLFTTPGSRDDNKMFENWFIASPPNNPIISDWIKEVLIALNDNEYVNKSSEFNKKSIKESLPYLICHLALKNVYERDKNKFDNIRLIDSNKTAFFEHHRLKWNNVGKNIFKNYRIEESRMLIKFRRDDRMSVDVKDIPRDLYM